MGRFRDVTRVGLVAGWCLAVAASVGATPITGTSTGVFTNPLPNTAVVTGVGTSFFTWGDGTAFASPPGSLGFAGVPFAGTVGTPFGLGWLTYFNGTIAAGTEATSVDLDITLSLTSPGVVFQAFSFPLQLINTPNGGIDPLADADIVHVVNGIAPETFFADGVWYTLEIQGFRVDGNFVEDFAVLEGATTRAELVGVVNPVPEPATLLLFGSGLTGLALRRRRRA